MSASHRDVDRIVDVLDRFLSRREAIEMTEQLVALNVSNASLRESVARIFNEVARRDRVERVPKEQ